MVIPSELDTTSIRTPAGSLRFADLWADTSIILPVAGSARMEPFTFLIWSVWPGLSAPDQLKSDWANAAIGRAAARANEKRWRIGVSCCCNTGRRQEGYSLLFSPRANMTLTYPLFESNWLVTNLRSSQLNFYAEKEGPGGTRRPLVYSQDQRSRETRRAGCRVSQIREGCAGEGQGEPASDHHRRQLHLRGAAAPDHRAEGRRGDQADQHHRIPVPRPGRAEAGGSGGRRQRRHGAVGILAEPAADPQAPRRRHVRLLMLLTADVGQDCVPMSLV